MRRRELKGTVKVIGLKFLEATGGSGSLDADIEEAKKAAGFGSELVKVNDNMWKLDSSVPVSFADSFMSAPLESQKMFKSWMKLVSHMSKLGYEVM